METGNWVIPLYAEKLADAKNWLNPLLHLPRISQSGIASTLHPAYSTKLAIGNRLNLTIQRSQPLVWLNPVFTEYLEFGNQ